MPAPITHRWAGGTMPEDRRPRQTISIPAGTAGLPVFAMPVLSAPVSEWEEDGLSVLEP